LASALPMAAGAAGGMLLGSALANAFSGGHSTLGSLGAAPAAAAADPGALGGSQDFGSALGGGGDAGFQDASFDDGDMGGGGDDDWV
ncbi:MAG: DUF2076 domain-containing protein, partial [Methylobacterium sp.]|nr:DUF2076 domain-containing protein [Methylobacterium sp.]